MPSLEETVSLCRTRDRFAAIEHLGNNSAGLIATENFAKVMRHFYWKEKDLPNAIAFGQAGAHHALFYAVSVDSVDDSLASEFRGLAKGLIYDLASFTWPGWDEPGIAIAAADLALGLDAARANLRLARELNKGDLPLSRAHWMLGGHQICAKDLPGAKASYLEAARHAAAAGARAEELLALGFARLVDRLIANERGADRELDAIEKELEMIENGPDFVQQIRTAGRVFGGSR